MARGEPPAHARPRPAAAPRPHPHPTPPHTQVAVSLGREHAYYSVFNCPVSRQIATKDNPPVMLRCGHVITKEAMENLPRFRGKCVPERAWVG